MIENLVQVQTVRVGTEDYRLVEVQGEHSRLAWGEKYTDEDSWIGGTPDILFDPTDTWHLGAFKSREGIPGTSEVGKNTDGRWPNRLLPGPKVGQITLTSCADWPSFFFECFGMLFVGAGQRLYRIDPSDDSVTLSKLFAVDEVVVDGVKWDGDQAVVATSKPGRSPVTLLYRLTALGTPDAWSSDDAEGARLAVGTDRLFAVNDEGILKNCLTGKNPVAAASWADEVQCGATTIGPTSLVAYERTAIVGKSEGVFGVSEEGKGIPLIKRMPSAGHNCAGMTVVEPYVFIPYDGGCLRFMPGYVESIGIERELLNENPQLRGAFRGFAMDGPWIFALLTFLDPGGAATQILAGREARQGEQSLGPYIWDTLTHSDQVAVAIHVSYLWSVPRLFWGFSSTRVDYSILAGDWGSPDPYSSDYRFTTAGTRTTKHYTFGTWRKKDFPKVDIAVRGATAGRYWTISYDLDRAGSWSSLDIDSAQMKADSDGLHTFYLPTTAKGHEIQFRLNYIGDDDAEYVEVVHFKPYAIPHIPKLRHMSLTLYLAAETRHNGGIEQRTSVDQLNDLRGLCEASDSVDCKGPWGDITVHPKRVEMLEARQEGHEAPRFLVELLVQERRGA